MPVSFRSFTFYVLKGYFQIFPAMWASRAGCLPSTLEADSFFNRLVHSLSSILIFYLLQDYFLKVLLEDSLNSKDIHIFLKFLQRCNHVYIYIQIHPFLAPLFSHSACKTLKCFRSYFCSIVTRWKIIPFR